MSFEYLESIKRDGLCRGDVPIEFGKPGLNGVWFTTDPTPQGHGLGGAAKVLTDQERFDMGRVFGTAPPPPGARFPDKREVRIKVMIPSSDRALVPWWKWGRKHCEPRTFDALNRSGSRYKTWFIYFGAVLPDRFQTVEELCLALVSEIRTIAALERMALRRGS